MKEKTVKKTANHIRPVLRRFAKIMKLITKQPISVSEIAKQIDIDITTARRYMMIIQEEFPQVRVIPRRGNRKGAGNGGVTMYYWLI